MTYLGITGHQRLASPDAWAWVTSVMREEIARFPAPIIGVTSLAIGADQVFARVVLETGGTIRAILPYAGIERSFSPEDLPGFRELLSHAAVEVLENPGDDEDAYLAAGHRVVELSEALFAVWDGKPAQGKGGTADAVAYAVEREIPVIHINPITRTVRWERRGSSDGTRTAARHV